MMRYFSQYDWLVSYEVMGAASVVYLTSIFVLKNVMKNQDKLDPKLFMQVYNLAQVVLCSYMCYGFATSSFDIMNPFGLNSQYNAGTEWFMLVHYLSKFLDYCDTWIMLVKKNDRQLTFLHVYHHTSILIIWGYLLQVGDANGTAYFGAFINSFIHLIMYSHYFITSIGLENPFKMFITIAQLGQFYLCIGHAIAAVLFEEVFPKSLAYLQFGYHITMIILFSDFFNKTYKGGKEGKGSKGKKEADATPADAAAAAATTTKKAKKVL